MGAAAPALPRRVPCLHRGAGTSPPNIPNRHARAYARARTHAPNQSVDAVSYPAAYLCRGPRRARRRSSHRQAHTSPSVPRRGVVGWPKWRTERFQRRNEGGGGIGLCGGGGRFGVGRCRTTARWCFTRCRSRRRRRRRRRHDTLLLTSRAIGGSISGPSPSL